MAVIDALSKAVYPRWKARSRFSGVIKKFGDWSNCDRMSLPHLEAYLSKRPEPGFEPLRRLVASELSRWQPSTIIELDDKDLEYEKARRQWPREHELPSQEEKISLEWFQHVNLLYTYRNLLIHEFRERQDRLGNDDCDQPIYTYGTVDYGEYREKVWDLFYPTGFFQRLARTTLENVEAYFVKSVLDPTLSFDAGLYWLAELNE